MDARIRREKRGEETYLDIRCRIPAIKDRPIVGSRATQNAGGMAHLIGTSLSHHVNREFNQGAG
jgi:hypothetical protein